jgi:hypothetical protein
MKPVTQSKTGDVGTCFRSCLASILELKEHEVPDINDFSAPGWPGAVDDFLYEHGLSYRRVPIDGVKPSGYSTIEGVSPRGGLHACVAYDGKLVHDPHPQDGTGRGLVEPRYYGLLEPVRTAEDLDTFITAPEASADQHVLQATDAVGFVCQECGGEVSRRYKNNICQYCLEEWHQAKLKSLRAARADLDAARGTPGYKAALTVYKELEKQPSRSFSTKATDRSDMLALRANTEKQGGPFFIQETEENGNERTIPVRKLRKY